MKKFIRVFFILLVTMLLLTIQCYARINFEVEKVEWEDKAIYDTKNHKVSSAGYGHDWSSDDDIPTIEAMPEPNVTWLYNKYGSVRGYVTKIDGIYYYAGRTGEKAMPLPAIPIGNTLQTSLDEFTDDYMPDLFPYNSKNRKTVFELRDFNESLDSARFAFSNIAKWVFNWNKMNNARIFVDGIYSIETNLNFTVYGASYWMNPNDMEIMFWEDEDTFYIRNFNILLRTPKQPLYDALNALEKVPKIKYNDTFLAFEQPPVIEDDSTLIPLRFLFEQMGADVEWNQETQTATISQDNTAVAFSIDNTEANVNGQEVSMEVPARLINGKTTVPVRFLSEELGYTVDWDGENRIITIK